MRCPVTGTECGLTGCVDGRCSLQYQNALLLPHQLGWQCPKCGRGNAPWQPTCPCGPTSMQCYADAGRVSAGGRR